MDRATSDRFASGTQKDLTSGNAVWETPPLVFRQLNEDFGPFDVDLTADVRRALCPVFFGPMSSVLQYDALIASWTEHGRHGYSNPPYGPFVQKMLAKAKEEAEKGFTSTLLLPMRVTYAFRKHILHGASELLFCSRRITFFENGEPRWNQKKLNDDGLYVPDPAMFDSIIVRFTPHARLALWDLKVGEWQVPEHVAAAIAKRKAA